VSAVHASYTPPWIHLRAMRADTMTHQAFLAMLLAGGCTSFRSPSPDLVADTEPESRHVRTLSRLIMDDYNACVAENDRRVLCWGLHTVPSNHPTTVTAERAAKVIELGQGSAKIIDLSLSYGQVCAAFDDGQLRCVKLGQTNAEPAAEALPLGFIRMSTSSDLPCVLADQSLRCGAHEFTRIKKFDGDGEWVCTLSTDNLIQCWNDPDNARPVDFGRVDDAVDVFTGGRWPCVRTPTALKCAGTVPVMLDESAGKEPRMGSEKLRRFRLAFKGPVRDVGFNSSNICVLEESGKVWCQGNNTSAQLGAGDSEQHLDPVSVPLPGPADEIDVAFGWSCALVENRVWCWGTHKSQAAEVAVIEMTTSALHLSSDLSCATVSGDFRCWGLMAGDFSGPVGIVRQSRPESVWSSRGQIDSYLGVGPMDALLSGGELIYGRVLLRHGGALEHEDILWSRDGVSSFAMSSNVLCMLDDSGTLECWLQEPKDGDWFRSAQVRPRKEVSAMSVSYDDVCAIRNGAVACAPVQPEAGRGWREIPGLAQAVALDKDPYTRLTCAILEHGAVVCWTGVHEPSGYRMVELPFALDVEDAVDLVVDKFGVCVRTQVGAVRCGQARERELIMQIESGAVEIDGGRDHWCARIDADGDGTSEVVECHGANNAGQLGRLGDHVMLIPTEINLPSDDPRSKLPTRNY
jgi:hypothetical protein